MRSKDKWEHIDYLPLLAIAIIILVCNMANLFVLKEPILVLATLPLLTLTVLAWRKFRVR